MYEDRCTMYVSQWLDYQFIAKHRSSIYLGFYYLLLLDAFLSLKKAFILRGPFVSKKISLDDKCAVIIIRYFNKT
jgi:spore coat polysaccharide biosynthesis predicted glycosyltransferase SpsG